MKYLQRLREPSTYAGLGILASLFHIKELAMFGAPEFGIALAGLASVFLPETPKQ